MIWLFLPVNNFSVMSWQVFLSWTCTKQQIKCLAQGHNTHTLRLHQQWDSNQQPFDPKSNTLNNCSTFTPHLKFLWSYIDQHFVSHFLFGSLSLLYIRAIRVRLATSIWYDTLMKNCFKDWSQSIWIKSEAMAQMAQFNSIAVLVEISSGQKLWQ